MKPKKDEEPKEFFCRKSGCKAKLDPEVEGKRYCLAHQSEIVRDRWSHPITSTEVFN